MSLSQMNPASTVERAADRPAPGAMKGGPDGRSAFAHAIAGPPRIGAPSAAYATARPSRRWRRRRRWRPWHTPRTARTPRRSRAAVPPVRPAEERRRSTGAGRRSTEEWAAHTGASRRTGRIEKSATRKATTNVTYETRRKATRRESAYSWFNIPAMPGFIRLTMYRNARPRLFPTNRLVNG
jgi:hypothetical protein